MNIYCAKYNGAELLFSNGLRNACFNAGEAFRNKFPSAAIPFLKTGSGNLYSEELISNHVHRFK